MAAMAPLSAARQDGVEGMVEKGWVDEVGAGGLKTWHVDGGLGRVDGAKGEDKTPQGKIELERGKDDVVPSNMQAVPDKLEVKPGNLDMTPGEITFGPDKIVAELGKSDTKRDEVEVKTKLPVTRTKKERKRVSGRRFCAVHQSQVGKGISAVISRVMLLLRTIHSII